MTTTNTGEIAKNKCIATLDQTRTMVLDWAACNPVAIGVLLSITDEYITTSDWKVFDALDDDQKAILVGILGVSLCELKATALLREEEAAEEPGS